MFTTLPGYTGARSTGAEAMSGMGMERGCGWRDRSEHGGSFCGSGRWRAVVGSATVAMVLGLASAAEGQDSDPSVEPFLSSISDTLHAMVEAHPGMVGFVVLDPNSDEIFEIDAETVFPAAGLMGVPVMIDLFHRVGEGVMTLEDPLALLPIDRTDGPGVLRQMTAPKELSVWDALYLMVTLGDNTATNLLLDKLRPRLVTERMRLLGLERTRLFMSANGDPEDSYSPAEAREYGMGSTTPKDMARMFAMLYNRELIAPDASDVMIGVLQDEFYSHGIQRAVPEGVLVAHKTDAFGSVRSDCGIVFAARRDFVICALTLDNEDRSRGIENAAFQLISALTRIVYDELN